MSLVISRRKFLQTAGAGLSLLTLNGCGRSEAPGRRGLRFADYKALVCVYLRGGNDGYNLLVPRTPEKYGLYAAARDTLAVPREQLLALDPTAADGAQYGLHPSCAALHPLFDEGRLALLVNVGNLSVPTTKADYLGGRVPLRLFSHSDQSEQWQTTQPNQYSYSGWAGRVADRMAGANGAEGLPVNISLAGSNSLQAGAETAAFSFSASGPQRLDSLSETDNTTRALRAAFDELRAPDQPQAFESDYARTLERGIHFNELIASSLPDAPELTVEFQENNYLAAQLKMVARLIGIRGLLGVRRQVFYVSLGGFDTHGNQAADQPGLFRRVAEALRAFHDATVELGLADAVTAFTASEFGRTLTINGQGSDHGWSSHHCIVGGAVRGGSIYGRPPSLVVGGEDDPGGGRFIPQTSVDEYAATLARWFGIPDGELGEVLPNLGRFATRDLGFMR